LSVRTGATKWSVARPCYIKYRKRRSVRFNRTLGVFKLDEMSTWMFILLCLVEFVTGISLMVVETGIFITSPNVSSAWHVASPQSITWTIPSYLESYRGWEPAADIWALWWINSTAETSRPIAFNGTAQDSLMQFQSCQAPGLAVCHQRSLRISLSESA
jgi:hypothetical protein